MVTAVVKSSEGDEGTFTKSSIPSKLNACPTSPGAKVVPPCSVPGLPSQISLALPSPGHQLTMPGGGGTHDGVGVGVGVTSGELATMTPGPGLFGRALFHRFCPNTTSAREMPVKQIATPSKSRGLRNADWEAKIFRMREGLLRPKVASRDKFAQVEKEIWLARLL